MRRTVELGLVVLFTVGCAERTSDAAARGDALAATEGIATAASAPGASGRDGSGPVAPGGTIIGTVREQIPVSPYVYLRVETPDGELWTAVAEAPFTVGAPVTIYNALPMEQFESATLQRTFDRIYFGALEPVVSAAHGGSGMMAGAPLSPDAVVGAIEPATGENAQTISALWLAMDRLVGKTVAVRGVVVKYNGGVMGKNWIHLQDGSGDPSIGTHDLTVTSLDAAAVGDTITVTGVVRTKVDVGAGYTYPLLLEDAKVSGRS